MSEPRPVRTAIWGSCISRDTFEFLPENFQLVTYIARQSLISAYSDAREACPNAGQFDSPFQQRVTDSDLVGDAYHQLHANRSKIDLLLVDACDERLGVVRLAGNTYVTRSVEKLANGSQESIDAAGTVVDFGTDEHFELWRGHAARLARWAAKRELMEKVLWVAPDWALVDETGEPSPVSFGRRAAEANALYARYYDAVEELGFAMLRPSATLASSNHQWGAAPFHFHDVTYEELADAIVGFAQPSR